MQGRGEGGVMSRVGEWESRAAASSRQECSGGTGQSGEGATKGGREI